MTQAEIQRAIRLNEMVGQAPIEQGFKMTPEEFQSAIDKCIDSLAAYEEALLELRAAHKTMMEIGIVIDGELVDAETFRRALVSSRP